MSSLTRVNYIAQQRLDLHHVLAAESYNAFDFRALITAFTGAKPFIVSGLSVIGKTGLSITLSVKDSMTFNPLDGNGSFYKGLPTDEDIILELPAEQENIFVEAKFVNVTKNPVNTAQWDPLALTGETVAGTEFSSAIDSQVLMQLVITANTIGFTTGSIPLLKASTDGANITKMVDCRDMMYRLGSGGVTPNPAKKFGWGSQRVEPVYSGTGVGNDLTSPFRAKDASGILNDKGISTLKDWSDAIMSRLCEITGSPMWYVTDASPNNPIYGYITGLDISRIFLDSESGHSIDPSSNVSLKWTKQDPTMPHDESSNKYILVSEGQNGLDDVSVVKWKVNYGAVSWELGGEFVSNIAGGSRKYTASRFNLPVSKAPCDGGNIYLLLERDITPPLASGNAVKWASNAAFSGFAAEKTVSGVTDDFTGIAVGDWIRKASEGFSQYYKVTALSDGVAVRSDIGDVADGTITAVQLDRDILTSVSTEEMVYFRSRYQQTDLFADTVVGQHDYRDSNFYWIGRRSGDMFILRGFGNLQDGEEALVQNDSSSAGQGGSSDVILLHAKDAVYSAVSGYSARAGAATTLLSIKKRKRDNTAYAPNAFAADNTGASLEYFITAPIGLMNVGDGLWVRLSDTTGGELVNGSVVDSSDDVQNLDTVTNLWEVRSPAENPLRNFDNKDVHLLARRVNLADGVTPALIFCDGSVIDIYGIAIDNYLHATTDARFEKEVYLGNKTKQSVLFIDQLNPALDGDPTDVEGRIDEDNVSFNYDKAAQELNLFNNTFGVNYHQLRAPTDQEWFRNLGSHSLTLGSSQSTVIIPGDLIVLGTESISHTQNLSTEDKLITLGIGNQLYGGGGSGIQVADNTLKIIGVQTYAGMAYVDITYDADPLYALGQYVGVQSDSDFDHITAGEMSAVYRMTLSASVAGEIMSMGGNVYRIVTKGIAVAGSTSTFTALTSPVQSFDGLSDIMLTGSDGDEAFMTSWSFGVKRNPNSASTLRATLTPFESADQLDDFKTIPTARNANFSRTRIPYAWKDGVGAAGSDTTFDFTDRLTWDFDTNTFRIEGTLLMRGHILPQDDDTWDVGSTTLRWRSMHVGPSSFYTHKDNTNTNWGTFGFEGDEASVHTDTDSILNVHAGAANQLRLLTDGRGGYGVVGLGNSNDIFSFGFHNPLSGVTQNTLSIRTVFTGETYNSSFVVSPSIDTAVAVANYSGIVINNVTSTSALAEQDGMFIADLTTGSKNFGIRSDISVGMNKWFIYGRGTGHSFLEGSLGVGNNDQSALLTHRLAIGVDTDTTTAGGILLGGDVELYRSANDVLTIADNLVVDLTTKLTQQAVIGDGTQMYNTFLTLNGSIPDVTLDVVGVDAKFKANESHVSSITGFLSRPATADFGTPTTVYDMIGYHVAQPVKGTLASVNRMTGIWIDDFPTSVNQSAAAMRSYMAQELNKWNLYIAGSASNYIAGSVGIGNTVQSQIEAFRLLIGTASDTTAAKGMSFGYDTNLYRSDINTLKTDGDFRIGQAAYVSQFANFLEYGVGQLPPDPNGLSISVFAKDQVIWQRESDGNTLALTNTQGNVYEEIVDVVAAPSGNNQMAVILANPLGTPITLPQDRVYLIGNNLVATTVAIGSGTLAIKKNAHGLTNGNIVAIRTTTDIGGITSAQITGSFAVTVTDLNTFQITTTGSAITAGTVGAVDRTTAVKTRYYLVGQQELEMYLNDVQQRRGVDWDEVGTPNSQSNIVRIYREINLKDVITWRIDSNGGQTMIGGAGGGGGAGTLQAAYNGGSVIGVTTGLPMTLIGTGTLMDVGGTLNATYLRSGSLELTEKATSPIAAGLNGIWVDTNGDLYFQNDTTSFLLNSPESQYLAMTGVNGGSAPMSQATPVCIGPAGTLQLIDVSDTSLSTAAAGIILDSSVAVFASGSVATCGLVESVGGAFSFGDVLYVNKAKELSNIRPQVGVDGFVFGDYVVKIGTVVRNKTNPLVKDILVNVQVVGRL